MKNIIAALLLSVCLSSVALAGEIPGSGPTCTQNCGAAQPIDEISFIDEVVTGLFALIF